MGLGLILGGAAEGYRQQSAANAAQDAADELAKQRVDRDRAEAVVRGAPVPDAEKADPNWDPTAAAQSAYDASAPPPKQGLLARISGALDHTAAGIKAGLNIPPTGVGAQPPLDPNTAAAAGLPVPQDAAAAAIGMPTQVPAGHPMGDPTQHPDTVDPLNVTYHKPTYTQSDVTAYMVNAARLKGDPAAYTAAVQAHQQAVQQDALTQLTVFGRTPDGLTNMLTKSKIAGGTWDYEPATDPKTQQPMADAKGQPMYNFTVNGSPVSEKPLTIGQANDMAREVLAKTPGMAEQLATTRSANERAAILQASEIGLKQAQAATDKQKADTESRRTDAQNRVDNVTAAQSEADLARQNNFYTDVYGTGPKGDALLHADELANEGKLAFKPVDKVIANQDGTTHIVTSYPGEDLARAQINMATQRFQSSPWAASQKNPKPSGIINIAQAPSGQKVYTVAGLPKIGGKDQAFVSLDAAENQARKIIPDPKAFNAKARAGKAGLKVPAVPVVQ